MTRAIRIEGQTVEVVRSSRRRKTAAIRIEQGRVRVHVPQSTRHEWIVALLDERRQWIRERLTEQSRRPAAPVRRYQTGERLPLLGADRRLVVEPGPRRVRLIGDTIHLTLPGASLGQHEAARRLLTGWYRQQALRHFEDRCAVLAEPVGVTPAEVRIRTYRARWGTCSGHGRVTFNWRLVMAPSAIIDHVVIHELCHLIHHDHGPDFWSQVRRHDPEHRQHRAWLRENGQLLDI